MSQNFLDFLSSPSNSICQCPLTALSSFIRSFICFLFFLFFVFLPCPITAPPYPLSLLYRSFYLLCYPTSAHYPTIQTALYMLTVLATFVFCSPNIFSILFFYFTKISLFLLNYFYRSFADVL